MKGNNRIFVKYDETLCYTLKQFEFLFHRTKKKNLEKINRCSNE